jgi:hypothetical protein
MIGSVRLAPDNRNFHRTGQLQHRRPRLRSADRHISGCTEGVPQPGRLRPVERTVMPVSASSDARGELADTDQNVLVTGSPSASRSASGQEGVARPLGHPSGGARGYAGRYAKCTSGACNPHVEVVIGGTGRVSAGPTRLNESTRHLEPRPCGSGRTPRRSASSTSTHQTTHPQAERIMTTDYATPRATRRPH